MLKKLGKQLGSRKFWLRLSRDIILLAIIVYAFNLYQTRNTPAYPPELNAQLISGEIINLSQMAKKAPVLLYFWGSWCPICSFTSSTMTDLAREYQVISIALSSGNKEQVFNYLKKNNYQFPVINDPQGIISQQWGVSATPTIMIINRKGEIYASTVGVTSSWGLKLRLWLAS